MEAHSIWLWKSDVCSWQEVVSRVSGCFVTYLFVDTGFGGGDTLGPIIKHKTQEMLSNVVSNKTKNKKRENKNLHISLILSFDITWRAVFLPFDAIWDGKDMSSCEMHLIVLVQKFLSNNSVQCTCRSSFPLKTLSKCSEKYTYAVLHVSVCLWCCNGNNPDVSMTVVPVNRSL